MTVSRWITQSDAPFHKGAKLAAIKIIEILGTSKKSWDDAAREALTEARKSLRGITGVELVSQTAKVKDGEIAEYHATCKIAFRIE